LAAGCFRLEKLSLDETDPASDGDVDADGDGDGDVDADGDVDGDVDGDSDGDADGDSDADGDDVVVPDIGVEGPDWCTGWLDIATGRCWEDPPAHVSWYELAEHCAELGAGWHPPSIDQLMTLVRGLDHAQCSVTDPLCTAPECAEDCAVGEALAGPGTHGCYWDEDLTGGCADWGSWSYSLVDGDETRAWMIRFRTGSVETREKAMVEQLRCVRVAD